MVNQRLAENALTTAEPFDVAVLVVILSFFLLAIIASLVRWARALGQSRLVRRSELHVVDDKLIHDVVSPHAQERHAPPAAPSLASERKRLGGIATMSFRR